MQALQNLSLLLLISGVRGIIFPDMVIMRYGPACRWTSRPMMLTGPPDIQLIDPGLRNPSIIRSTPPQLRLMHYCTQLRLNLVLPETFYLPLWVRSVLSRLVGAAVRRYITFSHSINNADSFAVFASRGAAECDRNLHRSKRSTLRTYPIETKRLPTRGDSLIQTHNEME